MTSKTLKTVQIVPTSKRAKERTKQHGSTMVLERHGTFRGQPAVLVRSLGKTYSIGRNQKDYWMGWFREDEIDFDKMS